MGVLGLAVVVLGYGGYLAMLFALRRFTYRTWLFHAVILVGMALALFGLVVGNGGLPALIAIGLGVVWFPLTRRELTLVGSERLTIQPGDRLPRFAALRTDGTPITDQDVVARVPALLVLYRGWWCPSTRALLDELLADHERLAAAGLTTFAASVDPPASAAGMQEHVGDGITIICSFPVEVLDAIGAARPARRPLVRPPPDPGASRRHRDARRTRRRHLGTDRLRLPGAASRRPRSASRHPHQPRAVTD